MTRWIARFALMAAAWALSAAAWAQAVVAPGPSNNNQSVLMFDVQATNALTVTGLSTNMYGSGTTSIEIWGRSGSHVGHTSSTSGWTLLGTTASFSAVSGTVYSIPLALSAPVPAGDTYAFMVRSTVIPIYIGYANGAGTPGVTTFASDANLRVLEGTGADVSLTSNFTPRQLVGEVRYTLGITPPTSVPTLGQWSLMLMALLLGAAAFGHSRRRR